MSADPEPTPAERSPLLGRALAFAFIGLFLMVGLGVFWVWHKAQREQDWRDRINATESFTAPRSR